MGDRLAVYRADSSSVSKLDPPPHQEPSEHTALAVLSYSQLRLFTLRGRMLSPRRFFS